MSKKIILAGFACLLLFLVSVAKSDPNRQQVFRPAALDVGARVTSTKAPTQTSSKRVYARKYPVQGPAINKQGDAPNRQ